MLLVGRLIVVLFVCLLVPSAMAKAYVGAGLSHATLETDFSRQQDSDRAFILFIGWQPKSLAIFSLEAAFHDFGSYQTKEVTAPIGEQSINTKATAFSAQVAATVPLIIFNIYAKLGIARSDYSLTGLNSSALILEDNHNGIYYAFGGSFTLLPVIDLYAEHQKIEITERQDIESWGIGIRAYF